MMLASVPLPLRSWCIRFDGFRNLMIERPFQLLLISALACRAREVRSECMKSWRKEARHETIIAVGRLLSIQLFLGVDVAHKYGFDSLTAISILANSTSLPSPTHIYAIRTTEIMMTKIVTQKMPVRANLCLRGR